MFHPFKIINLVHYKHYEKNINIYEKISCFDQLSKNLMIVDTPTFCTGSDKC